MHWDDPLRPSYVITADVVEAERRLDPGPPRMPYLCGLLGNKTPRQDRAIHAADTQFGGAGESWTYCQLAHEGCSLEHSSFLLQHPWHEDLSVSGMASETSGEEVISQHLEVFGLRGKAVY